MLRQRLAAVLGIAALGLTTLGLLPPPSDGAAAGPRPFGRSCLATLQVRWCPANGALVPSWDGTPLDADVTLPATGSGPWPTILLLHGLGGDKSQLEPNAPQQTGVAPRILPSTYHYSNLWFARRGYAVLSYTARGFGDSCGGGGTPAAWTQTSGPCANGFIHLADQRYEARDSQTLLGILADQGITKPTRIGVTGFSYGGGMAVQLAFLKNRIRLPDGRYAPWRSPQGRSMAIGAAYGQWQWSDLLASLLPNGRFLDFDIRTIGRTLQPLGVMVQSYIHALYGLAASEGFVAIPDTGLPGTPDTADWDLTSTIEKLDAGEPYGADLRATLAGYRRFHGSVGIPGRPAPLLLESGWADDIFPPTESLRAYNQVRARFPRAYVRMLLGDLGHGRDANKPRVSRAFNQAASDFFDHFLRGVGRVPATGSVLTYTTTCPASGPDAPPDGGPYRASSWARVHPGRWRLAHPAAQQVDSTGGNPLTGLNFDPIPQTNPLGTGQPCKTIAAETSPGTAIVRRKVTRGFTMLGLPTIRARISSTGTGGELAGRLWDVTPGGQQRLISRAVYRLTDGQDGALVFQLHGNGYRFRPGHVVKLELAPSDAPYYRASNGVFSVTVTDLRVALPTLERRP